MKEIGELNNKFGAWNVFYTAESRITRCLQRLNADYYTILKEVMGYFMLRERKHVTVYLNISLSEHLYKAVNLSSRTVVFFKSLANILEMLYIRTL